MHRNKTHLKQFVTVAYTSCWYRLISSQFESPPTSPKSAPISPLRTGKFFNQENIAGKGNETKGERPWRQAQKHHKRSHTVKYSSKRQEKEVGPSPLLISGPTNFTKADPQELYRQLINNGKIIKSFIYVMSSSDVCRKNKSSNE